MASITTLTSWRSKSVTSTFIPAFRLSIRNRGLASINYTCCDGSVWLIIFSALIKFDCKKRKPTDVFMWCPGQWWNVQIIRFSRWISFLFPRSTQSGLLETHLHLKCLDSPFESGLKAISKFEDTDMPVGNTRPCWHRTDMVCLCFAAVHE